MEVEWSGLVTNLLCFCPESAGVFLKNSILVPYSSFFREKKEKYFKNLLGRYVHICVFE